MPKRLSSAQMSLRMRAEDLLHRTRTDIQKMPINEVADMVYELQVYQIELQMQNEELQRTQRTLEETRQKYYDLYDFAPVGYLQLDKEGTILEANLMAGKLLGGERHQLYGQKLSKFVTAECQDVYFLHFQKVFRSITQQDAEMELKNPANRTFVRLHSLAVGENDDRCRTALIDISPAKKLEKELKLVAQQA